MLGSPFVKQRVDFLFRRMRTEVGRIELPVNLAVVCAVQRVTIIRIDPIATEGALDVCESGFQVRVRGDFSRDIQVSPTANISWLTRRQRFTVAHEIGHTLYYDSNVTPPRLLKGSPHGGLLEHFCHFAGRSILIPEFALESRFRRASAISGQLVLDMAERFVVSPEVALRRVADHTEAKSFPTALLLAEYTSAYDDAVIVASFWGLPMLSVKPSPPLFSNLNKWLGGWGKPEFWQIGDYSDVIEVTPDRVHLTKTMLPQDLRRFFLQVELSYE